MPITNYDTINGQIIGENTGGTQTNYMFDALGSVVGTKNSSGVVQNTYRYKPYGGLLAKTGTAVDPKFLWNGGSGYRATSRAHSDVYVRARHFVSSEGVWGSIDGRWPGQMPYVYSIGRPADVVDPSGLAPVLMITPPSGGNPKKCVCPSVNPQASVTWGVTSTVSGVIIQYCHVQSDIDPCPKSLNTIPPYYKTDFWEGWNVTCTSSGCTIYSGDGKTTNPLDIWQFAGAPNTNFNCQGPPPDGSKYTLSAEAYFFPGGQLVSDSTGDSWVTLPQLGTPGAARWMHQYTTGFPPRQNATNATTPPALWSSSNKSNEIKRSMIPTFSCCQPSGDECKGSDPKCEVKYTGGM